MKLNTKYLAPIGIIIFAYLLWKYNVFSVISVIKNSNIKLILLSLAFTIPAVLVKSYKWQIILAAHGEKINLTNATKIWLAGLFYESITPGRVGAIFRAFYFENKPRALAAAVIDRIIEVISLIIMGGIGMILVVRWFGTSIHSFLLIILFLIIMLAATYLFTKKRFIEFVCRPLYKMFIPIKYKEKVRLTFNDFYDNLIFVLKYKKGILVFSMFISLAAWLIGILQLYLVAIALGKVISYWVLFAFAPISLLVQLVPVTISGFGTREATMIFLFSLIGIGADFAIALSLMFYIVGSVIQMVPGMVLIVTEPVKSNFI